MRPEDEKWLNRLDHDSAIRFACGCRVRETGMVVTCKRHRKHFDIFHTYKFPSCRRPTKGGY